MPGTPRNMAVEPPNFATTNPNSYAAAIFVHADSNNAHSHRDASANCSAHTGSNYTHTHISPNISYTNPPWRHSAAHKCTPNSYSNHPNPKPCSKSGTNSNAHASALVRYQAASNSTSNFDTGTCSPFERYMC